MWYSYKNENSSLIDYSYLDLLFDSQEETNEFLEIFIKELELAKANFRLALIRRNTQLFRQTHHNVSPHLEVLKITNLSTLLEQAKTKILNTREPFEDKEVFLNAILEAFDIVIKELNHKITQSNY